MSEWTYSGMFSALWHTQVDHNIHRTESILAPSQNKASKGKLKPAGTEQQQNITSGSDGKLLPPADKRKQSHLELQTQHTGSLQDTHCRLKCLPSAGGKAFKRVFLTSSCLWWQQLALLAPKHIRVCHNMSCLRRALDLSWLPDASVYILTKWALLWNFTVNPGVITS